MLRHTPKGGITTNNKEDLAINKNADRIPVATKAATRSIRKAISPYFPSDLTPIQKPTIGDDFNSLTHVERVTESIKYNVLCLEYWTFPNGSLRQWIKINIALLLLVGIPILIFMPLITYFIGGVAEISELLANASQHLLDGALNILKLMGIIIAVIVGILVLLRILRL